MVPSLALRAGGTRLSRMIAQASEMAQHVADGDDADDLPIGENGEVAITAGVHLVQDKRERISSLDRFWFGSHELTDGTPGLEVLSASDFHQEIPFAQNANQRAVRFKYRDSA